MDTVNAKEMDYLLACQQFLKETHKVTHLDHFSFNVINKISIFGTINFT
jgi:hypothetical protein